MTRRIPIFEYNEELKSSKHKVYKSLIDGVTEAIKNKKETSKLCDVKNSGIGDKYDLAFADDNPDRKIYNHLTVDCIFNWKFGDAAVFDRTQLHAATDFTKHHQYKDAITVFFNSLAKEYKNLN